MVKMKGGGVMIYIILIGKKSRQKKSSPVPDLINVLLPNTGEEISHECSLRVFMSM